MTTSFSTCTSQSRSLAMEDEHKLCISVDIKVEIGIQEETTDPLTVAQGDSNDIATNSLTSQSIKAVVKKESELAVSDDSVRLSNGSVYELKRHMRYHTGGKPCASNINPSQTDPGTYQDAVTASSVTCTTSEHVPVIKDESGLVVDKAEIVIQNETIVSIDDSPGDPKDVIIMPSNLSSQSHKPAVKKFRGKRVTKPYACDMCDYTNARLYELKRHMWSHTTDKPYTCDKCDYSTGRLGNLNRHLKSHAGDKPYTCDMCGYCTGELCHLRRHVRIHTCEKPYVCDKCDYSTGDPGHLKRHVWSHTKDKPYTCDMCDYSAGQLGNLKKHMRSHTDGKPCASDINPSQTDPGISIDDISTTFVTVTTPEHVPVIKDESELVVEEGKAEIMMQDETIVSTDDSLIIASGDPKGIITPSSWSSQPDQEAAKMSNRGKRVKKLYACDMCEYANERRYELKVHMRTHTGEKPYTCDKCDYNTGRLGHLYRHKKGHTGDKPYSCDMCDYCTGELSHLRRHVRIHTGEKPYACDKCSYSAVELSQLKKHMWCHAKDRPYTCDMCDYSAGQLGNLKKHMRSHTGGKPCASNVNPSQTDPGTSIDDVSTTSITGTSLAVGHASAIKDESDIVVDEDKAEIVIRDETIVSTDDSLIMASGDPKGIITPSSSTPQPGKPAVKKSIRGKRVTKPYACDVCDYTNARLYELKRHMWSHTTDKPYTCDKCDYSTGRLGNLNRHLKSHAGDKPYTCDMCDYSSGQIGHLRRHVRSHTGEKPFTCDICGYSTGEIGHLKRHMWCHESNKPFTCNMCDYSAGQLGNLKRHIRSHTSEKPYACDMCDYSTGRSDELKRHSRTHKT